MRRALRFTKQAARHPLPATLTIASLKHIEEQIVFMWRFNLSHVTKVSAQTFARD